MMGDLLAHGHELTAAPEDADVIVVNTCSFIDPAKEESVNTILEMAEFKKTGKAQRLVVAGCLVERYRDDIRTMLPEVDAVLGTNELKRSPRFARALNRRMPPPRPTSTTTSRRACSPRPGIPPM